MSNFYRKKPVVIEAIKFTRDTVEECIEFTGGNLRNIQQSEEGKITGNIETLESQHGLHTVQENDYIIRGIHGEYYPIKPNIFYKTYEKVDEEDEE